MANETRVLEIKILSDTIKGLETQLKEANKELKAAKINTDDFNKASENYNKVKAALTQVNNELRVTAESTDKNAKYQKALSIAYGDVNASLGEMQKAMRLLKNESFEGKTKEEINKLNTAVGKLKNDIQDASAYMKATDKGEIFNNMAQGLRGAVAAAQLLGATFKVLGIESDAAKKLEQATMQLISATQALTVLMELKEKKVLQGLVLNIKTIASNALETASIWAKTVATNASNKMEEASMVIKSKSSIMSKAAAAAQWLWNAAIMANPIGAIILAVAALAAGIVILANNMNKETEAERKGRIEREISLGINKKVVESTVGTIASLKSYQEILHSTTASEQSRKKALDEVNKIMGTNYKLTGDTAVSLDNLDAAIREHIKMLEAQAKAEAYAEKYKELYKQIIEANTDAVSTLSGFQKNTLKYGDAILNVFGAGVDNLNKVAEVSQKETVGKLEEQLKIVKEGWIEAMNNVDETVSGGGKKIKTNTSNITKEVVDEIVMMRKKLSDIIEKERQSDLEKHLKQADDAIKIEEERLESLLELTRQQEEQKDADLMSAMNRIDALTQYEIDKSNERLKKELENEAKKKEARKQAFDSTATIVNTLASITNTMMDMELAKAGDNEEKKNRIRKQYADKQAAISIAQIIISTAQSIMQGYGQLGPIGGTIAAVLMAALGAVEVNAALQQRKMINAAAGGGDFETTKPTLLLVGDNPGGRERVSITPLSGYGKTSIDGGGLIKMAGGGTVTTDGGLSTRTSNQPDLSTQISNALKNMPAPIMVWADKTNFENKQSRIEERGRI